MKDRSYLFLLYCVLTFLLGCERVVKNGDPMENNSNAIYHGGVDGGHYFELIEVKNNLYRFKIFMDYNQTLFIDAYFQKVLDSCNFSFDDNNIHEYISNYDDNVIYLVNNKRGCKLQLFELLYR